MNVATYNLRKGGAGRCHWQKILDEFAVDVLLVQESYPPQDHLPRLLFPHALDHSVWHAVAANPWGSAVYCANNPIKPVPVSDHNPVIAELG